MPASMFVRNSAVSIRPTKRVLPRPYSALDKLQGAGRGSLTDAVAGRCALDLSLPRWRPGMMSTSSPCASAMRRVFSRARRALANLAAAGLVEVLPQTRTRCEPIVMQRHSPTAFPPRAPSNSRTCGRLRPAQNPMKRSGCPRSNAIRQQPTGHSRVRHRIPHASISASTRSAPMRPDCRA